MFLHRKDPRDRVSVRDAVFLGFREKEKNIRKFHVPDMGLTSSMTIERQWLEEMATEAPEAFVEEFPFEP